VAAGVARHYLEALGENINDLAFALVAPLCSDDDGRLAWFQLAAPRQWRVCRLASTRIGTTRRRLALKTSGFRDVRVQTGRATVDFTGPARAVQCLTAGCSLCRKLLSHA